MFSRLLLALSAAASLFWCPLGDARPLPSVPATIADADRREAHFTVGPYLQDARTDGMVVLWETDVPATGVVRVDLPGRRTAFMSPPGTHHEVRLSGLRPGTRYRYVVAIRPAVLITERGAPSSAGTTSKETRSEPGHFVTAPQGGSFTFLIYGDNRDRDADHAAVVRAMVPEAPDFLVQTGDMVGNAGEDSLWRRYFRVAAPLLMNAPMYPVLGNHELRGDPEASHFFRYFVLPGGEGRPGRAVYYSFHYGNSLFIILDGNLPYDGAQSSWLEQTLRAGSRDPAIRHIFVFVHQPPFAVGAYCGSERAQKRFVPLFSRYRVRAVIAGHEHAYQHLERGGVRYFISGGGGAPLYPRTQACTEADQRSLRLFRAEHHYLRVRIRGDEAILTAIAKSGQLIEQVLLHQPVPDRIEEPEAASEPAPPMDPHLVVLALPVSIAMGLAVAIGTFMLLRPLLRRRRKDLQPGGESPSGISTRFRRRF